MMNLYLANLGKYNEGELVGTWLSLPCTDTELEDALVEIGVATYKNNGEFSMGKLEVKNGVGYIYEEYAIHDWECDINGIEISEYSSLEELNELAEKLDSMDEFEEKGRVALLECGYIEEKDIIEKEIDDILGDYWFLELDDMSNTDESLGYELAEMNGIIHELEKIGVEGYFDYEKYGRDARYNGVAVASNNIAIL